MRTSARIHDRMIPVALELGIVPTTAQVVAGMDRNVEVHNVAVGGRPVFQCLQLYPQLVMRLYNPATTHNVIVFHAGDNDIGAGRDAKQTYAAFNRTNFESLRPTPFFSR